MKLTITFFIIITLFSCSNKYTTTKSVTINNNKNIITSKPTIDSINFSILEEDNSIDTISNINKLFLLKRLYKNIKQLNQSKEYNAAIYNSIEFKSIFTSIEYDSTEEFLDQKELKFLYTAFLNEYNLALSKIDSLEDDILIENIFSLNNINDSNFNLSLPDSIIKKEYTIPISINKQVLSLIYFFTHKGRRVFNSWFQRKILYEDIIYNILDEYKLPKDLIYIAMIESGFKTNAKSRAKAVGMWQFMKATGNIYHLKTNYWIDERRDYIKSTRAAAEYYTYLYNKFKDWYLAFASYNWGSVRTQRLVKKYKTNNFWNLYYFFPKETRMYVSTFIAAMIISNNHEYFGFYHNNKYSPIKYKTAIVDGGILLNYIARCAKTTPDTIKLYNPEFKKGCIPVNEKKYIIKIPESKYQTFISNYNSTTKKQKILYVKHHLKRGDSIYKLSKIYKTSVNSILSANNLSKKSVLRAGKYIIIPVPVSALQ